MLTPWVAAFAEDRAWMSEGTLGFTAIDQFTDPQSGLLDIDRTDVCNWRSNVMSSLLGNHSGAASSYRKLSSIQIRSTISLTFILVHAILQVITTGVKPSPRGTKSGLLSSSASSTISVTLEAGMLKCPRPETWKFLKLGPALWRNSATLS